MPSVYINSQRPALSKFDYGKFGAQIPRRALVVESDPRVECARRGCSRALDAQQNLGEISKNNNAFFSLTRITYRRSSYSVSLESESPVPGPLVPPVATGLFLRLPSPWPQEPRSPNLRRQSRVSRQKSQSEVS